MRIAVLDDYQDVARGMADWTGIGEVVFFRSHIPGADDFVRKAQDFDIIVAMRERTPFPRALLERLPKLRLLVTTGMRNRSIDVAAAKERGVTVCGTPGLNTTTAELAWGLILALARQIPREDRELRIGRWQTSVGLGLAGKTFGILGLGSIGQQVARIGAAFGMKLIAWSQNLDPEKARLSGAERVEKDDLFRQADILTIHLILSERTRGLVGARELALMKPSALLVNTSRGPIVDEQALAEALKRGTLAGAGIDVYAEEPIPRDHPLLSAPNTVLTPHLGYVTRESYRVYYEGAVEAIRAWQRGAPVRLIQQ